MLKHLVHSSSHPTKLHTFDDFYRSSSKTIRPASSTTTGDPTMSSNYSRSTSSSPLHLPCSPNNLYTFFNVFSDFKSNSNNDVLPEIDENEDEQEQESQHESQSRQTSSTKSSPLFYLDEDHQNHEESTVLSPSSRPQTTNPGSVHSPNWPSSIFHRFRHQHSTTTIVKRSSTHENQIFSSRTEFTDSVSRRQVNSFVRRAKTIDNPTNIVDKGAKSCPNDDFPELSAPTGNPVKKHRSFVSLLQHIHHHPNQQTVSSTSIPIQKSSIKRNSNSSSEFETNHFHPEPTRHKLVRQKATTVAPDLSNSPTSKSPTGHIIPKLASLFHRNHHQHSSTNNQQNFINSQQSQTSEQYKHRVGNLKARLHHRKMSPSSNVSTKFQCQSSNELIDQIKSLAQQEDQFYSDENLFDVEFLRYQRVTKPVVMKRVHTWHNSFDLRPIDQCLEY